MSVVKILFFAVSLLSPNGPATMGEYDLIVGPLLIGVFLNTYLFGLVSFQFVTYYTSGFKDNIWIRALVAFLVVVDSFHSLSLIYMAWVYCVTNFSNPGIFQYAIWPYDLTPIATAMTAIVTHLFLGYRIYRLTQSKLLYGFICIFATVVFAIGVTCGIRAWIIYDIDKLSVLNTPVTFWLSLQSGLDLLVSGIMVTRLYTSRTRFRQTNTVIYRLMRASVQTGIFCTIFAMADMISFLAMPQSNLFGMFAFPIGRIYTNTLMDTLNMREALKDMLGEPRVSSFRLASTSGSHSLSLSQAKEGTHDGPDHLVVSASPRGQSDLSTEAQKNIASAPSNLSLVSSEGRPKVDRESEFI